MPSCEHVTPQTCVAVSHASSTGQSVATLHPHPATPVETTHAVPAALPVQDVTFHDEHPFEPATHVSGLPAAHCDAFTVHATQLAQFPVVQDRPFPQLVPLGRSEPVSLHTDVPVAHDVAPVWHGFAGAHVTFEVHGTHWALLHTSFVPQGVPSDTTVPVSVHVATPLEHDVVPR